MNDVDPKNLETVLAEVRAQADMENIRVTQHAQQEMIEEDITLNQVLEAITTGQILENYPEHRRGTCCLLYGRTQSHRPLHIVCTTTQPMLIIITVYEPKTPKWITPTQRRSQQ